MKYSLLISHEFLPGRLFLGTCGLASWHRLTSVLILAGGTFSGWAQSLPALSVDAITGSQARISWTNIAGNVVLEESDSLWPTNVWRPSSQIPTLLNERYFVTIDFAGATRFFRLHQPPTVRPPPDPATVAPPLPEGTATPLVSATEFLYSGPNPIQTGVTNGTIQLQRAAVLRGRVINPGGAALSGVRLTVLNHPEFGQTLSRADGMFDLAVNGGSYLTVRYELDGFLPAQRQLNAPWQDFAILPDVALIPLDSQVTTVDLTDNAPIHFARGNPVTDSNGSRQATLLFNQGTTATLAMADGSTQAVTKLNVRATEYTVGPNGPAAMPGELPPASGYTYCVELTADEEFAAGAKSVNFSQPLIHYVENFLNFAVGTVVPAGYYDRDKAAWVSSDNGRVIQITGVTAGLAQVDTVGTNSQAPLALGDAERQQLATYYQPGQTLWRVPIAHFSAWDFNWPFGPPPDARAPNQPKPRRGNPPDDDCEESSSIIQIQSQTLGETVPITGTPFYLRYASDRVPGRGPYLDIALSGSTVPASLRGIVLEVSVAGRQFTQSFAPAPNLHQSFTWDGRDAYGRTVEGGASMQISIGYTYLGVYLDASQRPGADYDLVFGHFSYFGTPITADQTRREVTLWQKWEQQISFPLRPEMGGWSLSVHHAYDSTGQLLYQGDGARRDAQAIGPVVTTVAGNGVMTFSGDGGPATQAGMAPAGVAVASDGSLYIADLGNQRIRRVGLDGVITTVAGNGTAGFSGDGGPATGAAITLYSPLGMAIAPDGSLYITDLSNQRVRRVGPDGVITTVAGNGSGQGYIGDGGLATQARVFPYGVAVASDGSLYIADNVAGIGRIRRVGPDGIITTVAGGGQGGDGGPATQAEIRPQGLAVASDGSLYFTEDYLRIRRVGSDGIITTVAGNGVMTFSGDGGPAAQAGMAPAGVAVASDGSLYVNGNGRIRRVGSDGIIVTVAGNGLPGFSGDGGPATQAGMSPGAVAVAPDGRLYFADNNRIRRVGRTLPSFTGYDIFIASEDGSEVYRMNPNGRHMQTIDALTRAVRYQFNYDPSGRLSGVTDGDSSVTTIERDAGGSPTAIVSPYGQRTTLATDTDGYLSSITNPAGETIQAAYTSNGLLSSFTDPSTNTSRYTYDTQGRLIRAEDAAGGFWALSRSEQATGHTVSMTSAENRTNLYQIINLATGDQLRLHIAADGTTNQILIQSDGTRTATAPDGTVTTTVVGPDPRFGMQAPLAQRLTVRLPSGLSLQATNQRTVSLADPTDPTSLLSESTKVTVNGRMFTAGYDAALRQYTLLSPMNRQRVVQTDAQGRLVMSHISGAEDLRYVYDLRGRPILITQGSNATARTVTLAYSPQGYAATITNSFGQTLSFIHDAAGRVTNQTLHDGRHIHYTYAANGEVTSITPPGRPAHTFGYTQVNLQSSYAPPQDGLGPAETRYTYNLDRQLTRVTRMDGQSIDFDYTGSGCNCGHLSSLNQPRGATSYTYDPTTGNLTAIAAPGGITLTYGYDGTLLKNEAWSGSITGSVSRTYDNSLRVASRTINGADTVNFQYDNDSLLMQAGAMALTHDPQNGLLAVTGLGHVTNTWNYNGFAEATNSACFFAGATLYHAWYAYDPLGRISQKIEMIGGATDTFNYSYDWAGRLTNVVKNGSSMASYAYDSNGNRVSFASPGGIVAATYDDQDRLIQYDTTTYAYTRNGELLARTNGAQVTTYQYDLIGNLTKVTLPDGTSLDYLIDGSNRRIGKKMNGTLVQGFLYQDGLRPVAELDGNSLVVSRFVYATHANVPDYMIRDGSTYRIMTDHLGSPRLVVNVADGGIAQRMSYDEWGNVILDDNPGFQPFGFAGGLYDSNTRLVRFGARDYDAETGRWTAKDPLFSGDRDSNLYSYVINDPLNSFDQQGLDGVEAAHIQCVNGHISTHFNAPIMANLTSSVKTCLQEHEDTHINDVKAKYPGKNVCRGKPDGPLEVDKDTKLTLEKNAYQAELACLKSHERTLDPADREAIKAEEKFVQSMINKIAAQQGTCR